MTFTGSKFLSTKFLTTGILAAGLALGACGEGSGAATPEGGGKHPLVGNPAPSFEVDSLNGQGKVSFDKWKGKVVYVDFWATWCEPCIREWPQLDRLAERFAGRDEVVILAISMDSDPALIAPFLQRMSLADTRVRVLWDPQQAVQKQFGTEKLPDTYFIDRAGQIVHAFINVRDWGRPAAYQCVESMLAR